MFAGKEEFIKTKEKFNAINLWKEEDAFVSPFGVVFNNMRVIKETVYGMFNPAIYRKTFWKKRVLGKVDTINDIFHPFAFVLAFFGVFVMMVHENLFFPLELGPQAGNLVVVICLGCPEVPT